jgi:hypothetical protein
VGVLAGAGEAEAQRREDLLVALFAQEVLVLAEDDRVVGGELGGGLVAAARGVEVTCPHVQAGELHEVARLELRGRVLQLVLEQADQILDVVVEDEEAARALEREAVVGLNGESGPVVLQGAVLVGGGLGVALAREGLGDETEAVVEVGEQAGAVRRVLGAQEVVGLADAAGRGEQLEEDLAGRDEVGVEAVERHRYSTARSMSPSSSKQMRPALRASTAGSLVASTSGSWRRSSASRSPLSR